MRTCRRVVVCNEPSREVEMKVDGADDALPMHAPYLRPIDGGFAVTCRCGRMVEVWGRDEWRAEDFWADHVDREHPGIFGERTQVRDDD